MSYRKRTARRIVATVIGVGVVFGSVAGCGPGYRSSYYHRAPVIVHHHIVEHHHYYHHR